MEWKNILRWIAVIPAAIGGLLVGVIVASLVGAFQAWFIGAAAESGYTKIFSYVFASFAGGALSVYWGVLTAPSQHKIVGVILAALNLILSVLVTIFSISNGEDGVLWPILSGIAVAFGAGYIMYQIFEEGKI